MNKTGRYLTRYLMNNEFIHILFLVFNAHGNLYYAYFVYDLRQ